MKMTTQISAILLSVFTFVNVQVANARPGDIIRCNSKCWQDMSDLSDMPGPRCFTFSINKENENKFNARMDGGYDDDGNQTSYELGLVTKSSGTNGEVIWTIQKESSVKTIEFSQEDWTPTGTCQIKTKKTTVPGKTNYF